MSVPHKSDKSEKPNLITLGFVKKLDQGKKNATPQARPPQTGPAYQGCLAADAHWQIAIRAGQQYVVEAAISTRCDSRGWSCDNWATRSGPDGVPGYFVQGSLGYPQAPIGTLIGAISPIDAGASMNPTQAIEIFAPALIVGSHRVDFSPIDGFLYLIFNDTWTWSDNKGSIDVSVFM